MSAKTLAHLMGIFNWATLVVGVALFFFCGVASFSGDIVPVLVFMAVYLVLWLILWFLPVRCAVPGCTGMMRKTAIQLSSFKGRFDINVPSVMAFTRRTSFKCHQVIPTHRIMPGVV